MIPVVTEGEIFRLVMKFDRLFIRAVVADDMPCAFHDIVTLVNEKEPAAQDPGEDDQASKEAPRCPPSQESQKSTMQEALQALVQESASHFRVLQEVSKR